MARKAKFWCEECNKVGKFTPTLADKPDDTGRIPVLRWTDEAGHVQEVK